jgi:DUF1680 family protein
MKSDSAIRAHDALKPASTGSVTLRGWLGARLDSCLKHRVMAQEIAKVIQPFRDRAEGPSAGFRCEYWGKWFTSAALGYAYEPTADHRAILTGAVTELLATQGPDGYIGTYDTPYHLGLWDVWGRKYVLLGLLAYYDLTLDAAALAAARRVADHLLSEAVQMPLVDTGVEQLKGLAPSSFLEPLVLLYRRTAAPEYLQFAEELVAQWSRPSKFAPQGMRLLEDALEDVPPLRINSPKGYEMMSCFEGICELYRVTGNRRYLDAAVKFGHTVRRTERMIDGSGSNQELWCDGAISQTEVLEQPQETCVTVTWMKLCWQLLRLTGDPAWADELEISLYNALLAAMTPDGRWWSYWTALQGQRVPSAVQHADVGLSCCVANGPRGLLLAPRWAAMTSPAGPVINLYAPGSAQLSLADGSVVEIDQETDYPVSDEVTFTVGPSGTRRFPLSLRIPGWSRQTRLSVNGQVIECQAGTYARIDRDWSAGDKVVLRLDLRGRAVPAPSGAPQLAVMRGPILLSLDSRLTPPQDLAVRLVREADGTVPLTPRTDKPVGIWMAFDVPFEVRPSHFFGHRQVALGMCDFASAGNGWSCENLLRTWLPQPLYLASAYPQNTWKLMNPELSAPPIVPL